jgi:SPP1 family predicted phage head-tail adaptor
MLTDAELDSLRDDIERELLPDTVVITRATHGTAESYGYGGTVSWPAVGTAAARVDPVRRDNSRDEDIAGREAGVDYRQLTVPYDANITQGDKVTVGGRTYDVRTVADDHSLRAVRRAILVTTT